MKTKYAIFAFICLFLLLWLGCASDKSGQLMDYNSTILSEKPAPSNTLPATSADMKKEMKSVEFEYAPSEELIDDMYADPDFNTEEYNKISENGFKNSVLSPLSTFSIDVDKASYANIRRYLDYGSLPPADAVRIEELVNYFEYDYPQPKDGHPFSINLELADNPWNKDTKILLIGLQGKKPDYENLKPSNLVFLIDSSGSMSDDNKLPLLKKSLGILVKNLSSKDKIAIVTYAGSAGKVLDATPANNSKAILDAMDRLESGGSTAGAEGIELAYKIAQENMIAGGNNRVILCTDGDFNIGTSSTGDLVRLIEDKRKLGVYLTICGFGMGNYKDGRMEEISKAGNGNYFYIDSIKEAQKVFEKEMTANMFTLAKDVKIQVEFNPAVVKGYRLIGYENRLLNAEDFNDDKKDAGELGAGHTVTALYEIVPSDSSFSVPSVDALKYQDKTPSSSLLLAEMMTIKFRYKPLDSDNSILMEKTLAYNPKAFEKASENLRFAVSVAEFGMLLRKSEFTGTATWDSAMNIATAAKGKDEEGYRSEYIGLIKIAKTLSK
jgi:Ca-activated chloride channel family protein